VGKQFSTVDEVTYSVIAPFDEPRVRGSVLSSYLCLSKGLLLSLSILGASAYAEENYANSKAPNQWTDLLRGPFNYEITINGKDHRQRTSSAGCRSFQHGNSLFLATLPESSRCSKFAPERSKLKPPAVFGTRHHT
jgi:hypothetical protein